MKSAAQWLEENDDRIIHWATVRAIQSDAIRNAASMVSSFRGTGESDLRVIVAVLTAEANKLSHMKKKTLTNQRPIGTAFRGMAHDLAMRHAKGQMTVKEIVDRLTGLGQYGFAYIMMSIVSYLPDIAEVEFRKELAKRLDA